MASEDITPSRSTCQCPRTKGPWADPAVSVDLSVSVLLLKGLSGEEGSQPGLGLCLLEMGKQLTGPTWVWRVGLSKKGSVSSLPRHPSDPGTKTHPPGKRTGPEKGAGSIWRLTVTPCSWRPGPSSHVRVSKNSSMLVSRSQPRAQATTGSGIRFRKAMQPCHRHVSRAPLLSHAGLVEEPWGSWLQG